LRRLLVELTPETPLADPNILVKLMVIMYLATHPTTGSGHPLIGHKSGLLRPLPFPSAL
jgi:hypothetical protein